MEAPQDSELRLSDTVMNDSEQYSLSKICLIWALATAPMVLMAFVVTPAVIKGFDIPASIPAFVVFWPFMIIGLVWQFVLSLIIVKKECGNVKWATIRERRKVYYEESDHYQGTEFDQSKGITAGPFGSPYRYPGPMDAGGDTGDPDAKLKGAWERPISIYRCGFSYICQARGWLPDPIGGLVWFGPDAPMSTCYVPFYAGVTSIAAPYYTCDTTVVNQKSAWWAFNFVANWAGLKYSYMIKDIQQKQDKIELAEIEGIKRIDALALALYKKNPKKARKFLTTYCETQATQVVKDWWNFAWLLVARYDDGYVNAPGKMAQEVGYPDEWYEKSEWKSGPTTYKKPSERSR
jgi:hypothetical protein